MVALREPDVPDLDYPVTAMKLDIEIENDDVLIGGLVTGELGRIPRQGRHHCLWYVHYRHRGRRAPCYLGTGEGDEVADSRARIAVASLASMLLHHSTGE